MEQEARIELSVWTFFKHTAPIALCMPGLRAGCEFRWIRPLSRARRLGLEFNETDGFLKERQAIIPLSLEEFQRSSESLEKLLSR